MTTCLTEEQKFEWLSAALLELSSLPKLDNKDFAFEIFEELDINVHSALSQENVDFLASAHCINMVIASEILSIREMFLSKITALHSLSSYSPEEIRKDEFWDDVSMRSTAILKRITS